LRWVEGPPRSPNREFEPTGWAVTSEFNGLDTNTTAHFGDLGSESTDVVLVVVKLTFGNDNIDQLAVYIDPEDLDDESKCQPRVVGTGNFAFDRIGIANFDGRKDFSVGRIRIGTTFHAVISEPFDSIRLATAN
jgi:hypothetical protein